MKTAADIARLVRDPETSFQHAVELIQMFADREANAAVVRATQYSARTVTDTLAVMFESPLARMAR